MDKNQQSNCLVLILNTNLFVTRLEKLFELFEYKKPMVLRFQTFGVENSYFKVVK